MDAWVKNDPSRYLDHWETPQLVIHNEKDYRLCISEGLAAFNVLQARGIDSQFLTFPVSLRLSNEMPHNTDLFRMRTIGC